MVIAYILVTTGICYFLLFQLAVYNKSSLPLNEKVTAKGNFENTLQLVIEMMVFFVPVVIGVILTTLFGDTMGYIILIAIGAGFTFTHNIWLMSLV